MLYSFKDNWNAFVDGLLPSLICIILVFIILAVVMAIVMVLNHIKISKKNINNSEVTKIKNANVSPANKTMKLEDIKDEEMMVAVLIATIDYRKETKKDVRLINVKQVG